MAGITGQNNGKGGKTGRGQRHPLAGAFHQDGRGYRRSGRRIGAGSQVRPCLLRVIRGLPDPPRGQWPPLRAPAQETALAIGAGHSFVPLLAGCFPINVLNAIRGIREVCTIFCATANAVEVVIAESGQGRGIPGVIDSAKPKGVEGRDGVAWQTGLLRKSGYRRGQVNLPVVPES